MPDIRDLRLQADYERLMNINKVSDLINVEAVKGNPPVEYMITFRLRGYINDSGHTADRHNCRLKLPRGYPLREPLSARMVFVHKTGK